MPDESRFVVISGCSGGGKSTLLAELARRGFATIEEPGRRIVREELAGSGVALPWANPEAFARRAIGVAQSDLQAAAQLSGWVFFDRGLVDAAAALEYVTGEPALRCLASEAPYRRSVFLAPPWPELYAYDEERRHGFDAAEAEYRRLLIAYAQLGYDVTIVPKDSVSARADFVCRQLGVG